MRAQTIRFLVLVLLSAGFLLSASNRKTFAADGDAAVMQEDRAFVQAAAKGDAAGVGKKVGWGFNRLGPEGKNPPGPGLLLAAREQVLRGWSGVEGQAPTYVRDG